MNRAERIGDEMRRQISELILRDIKDPRLPRMTSVTRVRVTRDLSRATIYVSVFGSDDDKQSAITALTSALGFIRREIGKRMRLRIVPELQIEHHDLHRRRLSNGSPD